MGGKRRLLPAITAASPVTFERYLEPFVGGGAVFFGLGHVAPARLSDLNPLLINFYRVLRDALNELLAELAASRLTFTESEYRTFRSVDPDALAPVRRAVWFLYLNKTSFNGIWRVNREGRYNVPWGGRSQVALPSPEDLTAASRALRNAELVAAHFSETLRDASPTDFVYLDPPYVPLSPTASFTSYTPGGFLRYDQRLLAATIEELTERETPVMLSNSDTPETRRLYQGCGLRMYRLQASRSLAASSASRGRVAEILAVNYPKDRMRAPLTAATLLTSL